MLAATWPPIAPPIVRITAFSDQTPTQLAAGKDQAVGFLVGQVMKATRGQANAALVQAAVRERLDTGRAGEG